VGLRYLTTHGWDPDSRLGLGAKQEGIRIPVKPKEKHDTEGLRESQPDDSRAIIKKKATPRRKEDKVVKLNAKQVRIQDTEVKRRADRLDSHSTGLIWTSILGRTADFDSTLILCTTHSLVRVRISTLCCKNLTPGYKSLHAYPQLLADAYMSTPTPR
jgi:hypothetical protein